MRITVFIAFLLLPLLAHAETTEKLPRFASVKSDETNVRAGPGTRYAIRWVYKRAGLPVEITQEFDGWREIRDQEGGVGWVHKSVLSNRRTAVITKERRVLRRSPDDQSGALLQAEPGVMGRILACETQWCRLQINSRKGWLRKNEFWGVYPKEEFKE